MEEKYIKDIRKYLNIIENSFNEATGCKTCNESCCDIFHNIKRKIFYALDQLENSSIGECDMCTTSNDCYEEEDDDDDEYYDEDCDFCIDDDNSCSCEIPCYCEIPRSCENIEICEHKSIYLTSFLEQEVASLGAVSFEKDSLENSLEEVFEKTSNTTVLLKESGYYSFSVYLSPQKANETIALFLNNVEVPLTRYTTRSASSILVGTGILNVPTKNSVLTVVNVSDKSLKIEAGKLENTVTTSLLLTKL